MAVESSQNYFLDTILGKFATKVGIMDAIVSVAWDDKKKEALIHFRPPDPEIFDEVKELISNSLKEINSIKFKARGQFLKYRGSPSMIVKIKQED